MGRLSGGVRAGFVLGAKGTKPQLSLPLPLWSHVNSTLAEIANLSGFLEPHTVGIINLSP